MGQAKKTPRKKKESKEDVLKKEITTAVNRKVTAKVGEVKKQMENVEQKIAQLEERIENVDSRAINLIGELREEIEKIQATKGGESTD